MEAILEKLDLAAEIAQQETGTINVPIGTYEIPETV